MRSRISVALALLALTITVAACSVVADVAPAPRTGAEVVPMYAPEEYHDSSWGLKAANAKPVYAPTRYHDVMWGEVESQGEPPVYTPAQYHDSHWDPDYGR